MQKLQKISNFTNKIFLNFLETIFPRFCLGCEKEGRYICEECALFISEAGFICPRCQKTSYFGEKHQECKKAKDLNGLINIWDYEGIIKQSICNIKYNGAFHILEELIEHFLLLAQKDKTRFSLFFNFLFNPETHITFVPIHYRKKNKRGFNQSEILANYFAKITGKEAIALLKRIKETKSQTGLNREERIANVKDIFSFIASQENIKVKKVLIIDDVWTSGATMKACSRALKENGAEEVWGFTLART